MTTFTMVGDSQSGGLRVPLALELTRKGWVALGAWHQDGADTRRIDDNLLDSALAPHPDVLVVNAGGNDAAGGEPLAWGELLTRARAAGVERIVWIGPPGSPSNADLDERRRAISVAQRAFFSTKPDVQWIDGRSTAADLPRADDVHLTIPGYAIWASRLAGAMTSSGVGKLVVAVFAVLGLTRWAGWWGQGARRGGNHFRATKRG